MNTTDPYQSDFAGPCARCGHGVPSDFARGDYPGALSRFDNATYICSQCGQNEALMAGHLVPLHVPLDSHAADLLRARARATS